MAEPKDGESFFRKVVRFVANPATDWSDLSASRQDDSLDLERSELKAMIERKRRNDFVRKREFDTLRKLRRDGLSPEQLAALGGTSKVEDSEVRLSEPSGVRSDAGVKAKIDEIEQQMVGEGAGPSPSSLLPRRGAPHEAATTTRERSAAATRSADFYNAPTMPAPLMPTPEPAPMVPRQAPLRGPAAVAPLSTAAAPSDLPPVLREVAQVPPGVAAMAATLPTEGLAAQAPAMEVSEVVHDPELDEAVIAFANADFAHCQHALEQQMRPGAARHHHAETWMVLFDLYRATGQQPPFEALALDFAGLFGRSAPQWFSLPRLVADAAAVEPARTPAAGRDDVGWVAPQHLDAEAVASLRSTVLQLPQPWVLDWGPVHSVDTEAADRLVALLRQWAPQRLQMRWMATDQLLALLSEQSPTGVRDADPSFWMARLEVLRLINRPDQFDEAAIDYCVTYEVSPPSWEHAQAQVRSVSTSGVTSSSLTIIGEASSAFAESHLDDSHHAVITTVELSGQLAGDIGPTLAQLDRRLGSAALVHVNCAKLIRVDFIAAGDLLNWVLAKRSENRSVTFADAHRLVALFFGAMGINEHARVQVPRV